MKPKQAATLLESNHKYLTIMAVRGAKGMDFDGVERWYSTMYNAIPNLI
jgi:hypothetical protein